MVPGRYIHTTIGYSIHIANKVQNVVQAKGRDLKIELPQKILLWNGYTWVKIQVVIFFIPDHVWVTLRWKKQQQNFVFC